MAPKSGKGKGVAEDTREKETPESEAAARRAQAAYFVPSFIDALDLRDYYKPLWGVTSAHPATRALPADCKKGGQKRYPFFVDFFFCGLCPPFSTSSTMSCALLASICWILCRMLWQAWCSLPTFVRASPGCSPARRSSATTSTPASNMGRPFWERCLDPEGPGKRCIPGEHLEGEMGRVAGPVVLDCGEGPTGVLPGHSSGAADPQSGLEQP